jgi:hypothetical protein
MTHTLTKPPTLHSPKQTVKHGPRSIHNVPQSMARPGDLPDANFPAGPFLFVALFATLGILFPILMNK